MRRRTGTRTETSNFGVGARESHDSTKFYERFRAPELSTDDTVAAPIPIDEPFVCGDARDMRTIADGSVALVVTSPPYFAGKQYEEELERDGIPASYLEYLDMLTAVFAECVRTLEPGGRIAVNVANLGRKPYRSLSADVIRILEHDLGLLLRGEIVWRKGDGASGSCAWGSYRGAGNPVLRDVTERVIVASKGRFDRALPAAARAASGLPHRSTILADDFMNLTLDVWSIPPESAKRVGHPAPFPVELPEQLIRLYTFADDLVLDPFMGSGSTMVAASRLGRRYVGYDLDPSYVELARTRVADEGTPTPDDEMALDGRPAGAVAEQRLVDAGFTVTGRDVRARGTGISVAFRAADAQGRTWWFDVAGTHTAARAGLHRAETVWRALGRATVLRAAIGDDPLVLLATGRPKARSDADLALRSGAGSVFADVIDLLDPADVARLAALARGGSTRR
jgi:site-specific DNA-methyltransferase (adenine-specific)